MFGAAPARGILHPHPNPYSAPQLQPLPSRNPPQARAYGAWSWLAAVCFFTIKELRQDAEQALPNVQGATNSMDSGAAISGAAISAAISGPGGGGVASRVGGRLDCRETLEAGAARMARAHLAVMLARLLLEGAAVYPAAMACVPMVAASLLPYMLVLLTTGEQTEQPAGGAGNDRRASLPEVAASLAFAALQATDEPSAANDWGRLD